MKLPGCSGKRGYPTRSEAKKARVRSEREFGKRLFIYSCRWCNQYHLASRQKERKRKPHHHLTPETAPWGKKQ